MKINFIITAIIPAEPREVYGGWLDSKVHGEMTGAKAEVSDKVGGKFHAWDKYISGINIELEEGKRILQKWRTTEFEDSDEDSILEVVFESDEKGTRITLNHSNLPEHGMQYKEGWKESYFEPMKEYFSK